MRGAVDPATAAGEGRGVVCSTGGRVLHIPAAPALLPGRPCWAGPMREILREAADLFLPADCAVCAEPGHRVCPGCRGALAAALSTPARVEEGARSLPTTLLGTPLPAVAAGAYDAPVSVALLAYKDHDAHHLVRLLAPALHRAVGAALADPDVRALWTAERLAAGTSLRTPSPAPVLVPVPGSASGFLRRGRDPLADLLARPLPWPARIRGDVVRAGRTDPRELWSPAAGAHAGTTAAARRRRARCWRPGATLPAGTPVVLVDDVITTGSTLAALARRVRRAGGVPVAAAAVAGVAPPDSPMAEPGPEADSVT